MEKAHILNNGQEKIIKELQNKLNPKLLEIEKGLKPILDERKEKQETQEKQEKEINKFIALNDNINLINDFTNFNITNF